jgi:prolyl 4-hydroxylase
VSEFDALHQAAFEGDLHAQFGLARFYASQRQYSRARRWFERSAESGLVKSLTELGHLALYGLGMDADAQRAIAYFKQAHDFGDPEAPRQLAMLGLLGRALDFSAMDIRAWVHASAARGDAESARVLNALFGGGAIPEDFFEAGAPDSVLRAEPVIRTHEQVLTQAQCEYLKKWAEPALTPALVYEPRTGERVRDPQRNNQVANLGRVLDLGLTLLEARMLAVCGVFPLAKAEPLSVLKYSVGEEYQPHRDYLNQGAQPDQFPPRGPGQRLWTVFCYLNDVVRGGQTAFPSLGFEVQPKQGRAVVFANVDAELKPDMSTLHASLPVIEGEKWLATLWIRQYWAR